MANYLFDIINYYFQKCSTFIQCSNFLFLPHNTALSVLILVIRYKGGPDLESWKCHSDRIKALLPKIRDQTHPIPPLPISTFPSSYPPSPSHHSLLLQNVSLRSWYFYWHYSERSTYSLRELNKKLSIAGEGNFWEKLIFLHCYFPAKCFHYIGRETRQLQYM